MHIPTFAIWRVLILGLGQQWCVMVRCASKVQVLQAIRPAALSIQLVTSMRGWVCVFPSHTYRGRPISIVQHDRWPQTADSGRQPERICGQAVTQPKPIRHWAWTNWWKTKPAPTYSQKYPHKTKHRVHNSQTVLWNTWPILEEQFTTVRWKYKRMTVMEDQQFTTKVAFQPEDGQPGGPPRRVSDPSVVCLLWPHASPPWINELTFLSLHHLPTTTHSLRNYSTPPLDTQFHSTIKSSSVFLSSHISYIFHLFCIISPSIDQNRFSIIGRSI